MPLPPGTRLGPYEVAGPLGAGGMGEVYRARDTRLGRDVAIKVLPAQLASDPEFRGRLDREARAVSSLSHPNICPLYDVGHQDGIDFLVMEYLEGDTLAARLARGPLPPDQVLRYGIEIADALAAAHRRGIVHRDLKPGNVMLTRAGARLLDFGLAKPDAPVPGALGDLTVSAPITSQGTVIGTFQYMSPEQVEGRQADARSDIFALGSVLYEMATGTRAFDGRTTASVIAAILEREPPAISTRQPLVPAGLDDIVRGCLAKDPDERWGMAHDVKLQLQTLRKRAAEPVGQGAGTRARVWPMYAAWSVAAAAVIVAAWLATRDRGSTSGPASQPPVRASIPPPAAHSFTPNDFAISPDGRRVTFVAAGADGVSTLWVRSLETGQAIEIAGSEAAESPFWSADSRWIAFFMRGRLMKVDPGGMGLQRICDVSATARGGAWNQHGDILFSNAVFGGLYHVRDEGGTAKPATSIPADMPGEAHRFPQFLSDGRQFIYFASWTNQQRGGIYLASLDAPEPQLLSSDIRSRTVLVNGHLIYAEGNTVYAQRLDEDAGTLLPDRRAVLRDEVAYDVRFGDMPLGASSTGTLVYRSRHTYPSRLVWFDRSGKELEPVGRPGFSAPALSPDGTRVAVLYDSEGTGETRIWIHDLKRSISTPFNNTGIDTAHAWSVDGHWIAYSSMRAQNGLFRRPADGSGREETIHESPAQLLVNAYSPDGARVLAMEFAKGTPELRAFDVESRASEAIVPGAEGVYSPDGKWIAHLALPVPGVRVRPVNGGASLALSDGVGSQVRWHGRMKELYYIAPDRWMMAVPLITRNGALEPGPPRRLFQTRIVQPRLVLFQYDVTPDGERFLINSLPREDTAAPLEVIVNWAAPTDGGGADGRW